MANTTVNNTTIIMRFFEYNKLHEDYTFAIVYFSN